MQDLYDILGAKRDASADDLKKAYRKAARKNHPDVNPGDEKAEERFKNISAAYDVLGDEDKRKAYDEFGEDAVKPGFDPDKAREYAQWKQARSRTGHPFEREVGDFDLGDLGDLFGGFSSRGRPRPRDQGGADVHATVDLDLATALRGTEVELKIPITEPCKTCHGAGLDLKHAVDCGECGGTGRVQVARGPMRMTSECPACGGRGKTGPPCPTCRGTGTTQRTRTTRVRIPPGADNGDTLRIAGKGMPGRGGGPAGDLVIETRVKPHPRLRRKARDLYLRLPVTLAEAYNGAPIDVPTLSGSVKLTVPPRSQPGAKLRLRGKGVKRGNKTGDLYVELDVRLPTVEDADLAEAVKRSSALYDKPVRQGLAF